MKLFLGRPGPRIQGRARTLRPILTRMTRRSTAMVTASNFLRCVWLLAMLFCQTASALNACGSRGGDSADPGAEQVAALLPCHDSDEHSPDCDVADCVVGQGLTDVSGPAFVGLPIDPKQFEWLVAQYDERFVPMRARARAPGYPPPHVLGRLLI